MLSFFLSLLACSAAGGLPDWCLSVGGRRHAGKGHDLMSADSGNKSGEKSYYCKTGLDSKSTIWHAHFTQKKSVHPDRLARGEFF
jgi:hypothetical protein